MVARRSAAEDRRIDEVVRSLETVRDGDGPGLRAALPAVREVLDSDIAAAYGFAPQDEGLSVEFLWGRGYDPRQYAADLDRVVRNVPRFAHWDPFRPERRQRNRVMEVRRLPDIAGIQWLAARHRVLEKPELRVLLCEGESLLAWFGVLRDGVYGPREHEILRRLVEPLRRRAVLDRHLAFAPGAMQLLGAAMEAIGAPAYLLRRASVVHANAAGKVKLTSDRTRTLELLRGHLDGRAKGAFTLTRHLAPGAGEHVLAIAVPPQGEPVERSAAFARRWGLTKAQRRVVELVATGASNKAVAASLLCAESTVEFHVTALLAKTECESRAALAACFWKD
jgi:DNA-binding CsgD family transcriptional regulator